MSENVARVELQFRRSTASFHRYEAADEDAPVPNLYVAKNALAPGASPPERIVGTVTMDAPPT